MTAIVGVLCTDGVVVGTDSSATFGPTAQFKTIEHPTDKLEIVAGKIIIAGTGQVGLGQRFQRHVELHWSNKRFKDDAVESCRTLCEAVVNDFASTKVQMGTYGCLLAFPAAKRFQLGEFAVADLQPELKLPAPKIWWASMGSSQPITDPFLALLRSVFWPASQPNVREGTFAVLWALQHAIEVNPGGVNGPARLAVLQKDGSDLKARLLTEQDVAEHYEAIEQARDGLRQALKTVGGGEPPPDARPVPKPVPQAGGTPDGN